MVRKLQTTSFDYEEQIDALREETNRKIAELKEKQRAARALELKQVKEFGPQAEQVAGKLLLKHFKSWMHVDWDALALLLDEAAESISAASLDEAPSLPDAIAAMKKAGRAKQRKRASCQDSGLAGDLSASSAASVLPPACPQEKVAESDSSNKLPTGNAPSGELQTPVPFSRV